MKAIGIGLAATVLLAAGAARAGDVEIRLTGVQARPGQIEATLTDKETFMRPGGRTQMVSPADGEVVVRFADVPPGDYAFMAYHDENGDGDMQFGPTGMPSEGWALSNAERLMGPPDFETMKFTVPADGTSVTVAVTYPSAR